MPILGALFAGSPLHSQTPIFITSTADDVDDDPNDGLCLTAGGACTLRAALMHANATGGSFLIDVGSATYTLTIPGGGENQCLAGDLDIFGANVTIRGTPGAPATFDAAGLDRFLDIHSGVTVSLEHITITGGDPGVGSGPGTTSADGGGLRIGFIGPPPTVIAEELSVVSCIATTPGGTVSNGGGIHNDGDLTLLGGELRLNQAKNDGGGISTGAAATTTISLTTIEQNSSQRGGGLDNDGTTVLDRVTVAANATTSGGGGIRNTGALTGSECVVRDNDAGGPGTSVSGGGIFDGGTMVLTDSTIAENTTTGFGGGVAITGIGSSLELDRCTLSANIAALSGGGLHHALGTVLATNSTLSGNQAVGGAGGGISTFASTPITLRNVTIAFNSSQGGGAGIDSSAANFEIRNCLISDNPPTEVVATGGLIANGVNLVADASAGLSPPHITGVLGLLAPLDPNGGPTQTHALLPGSPAIDAGSPADCALPGGPPLAIDQRSAPRPEDGDGDGVAVCDIGSFEAPGAGACVAGGWNLVPVPAPTPPPNVDHAMVFDSARNVVVSFGGSFSGPETWEYDGGWQLTAGGGPGPRWLHGMVFDTQRAVTVLFGGRSSGTIFADTWEYDGLAWAPTANSGPPARTSPAMAYDSARGVTVLFGGETFAGGVFGDTWEYDGVSWVQRFPGVAPGARSGAAMSYDAARGVCVLTGGSFGSVFDQVWEWDGTTWTLATTGGPQGPRVLHDSAYDATTGRTLVYGGPFAGDDVWGWDGSTWQFVTNGGPGGRNRPRLVHDPVRQVTVLFGGADLGTGVPAGDTWEIGCPATPSGSDFVRGTCAAQGLVPNIGEAIFLLGFLFGSPGGPLALPCEDACDANDSGSLDIADAIYLLGYLFTGGPPPPPPFPNCGPDPTPDPLRCALHPCP